VFVTGTHQDGVLTGTGATLRPAWANGPDRI
jgi:hypothetical protein